MKEIEEIMEEENQCVKIEADEKMLFKITESIKASHFFKKVVRIASKYKNLPLYLEFRYSFLHNTLLGGLFAIGDGTMDTDPGNAKVSFCIPEVHIVEQQLGELLHVFLYNTRQSHPEFTYATEFWHYKVLEQSQAIIGRTGTLVQTYEENLLDGANNQIVARTGVKVCPKK